MKKASRNLVLRSETVRTLGNLDLSRVIGGGDAALQGPVRAFDTGIFACSNQAVIASTICAR
jgi:hypothetical protein